MHDTKVVVHFGCSIPSEIQGRLLLLMERLLHDWGIPDAVCEKETMPDDSKLRRNMTPLQRANL